MKKVIPISLIIIFALFAVVWIGTKDAFEPISRKNISTPIYTIGDLSYNQALENNKKVIKFGPLFWDIYPGGLAFKRISDAEDYFKKNKKSFEKIEKNWAIYKLSGDFNMDTSKKQNNVYTNKSLFVIKLSKKL